MKKVFTLTLTLLLSSLVFGDDKFWGPEDTLLEERDSKYAPARGNGLYNADHLEVDGDGALRQIGGETSGGASYENSQDMDGQTSEWGITAYGANSVDNPYIRILVATDQSDTVDTVYYGWQFNTDNGTEVSTISWFEGSSAITSKDAVDVSSHDILLSEAHTLRSVLSYNSSTELRVDAYVDDVLVDTLYVESGSGAVDSWGGSVLDASVEFFGTAAGRYPGMLWYDLDSSADDRALFTFFDDGVSFDNDGGYTPPIGIPDPADDWGDFGEIDQDTPPWPASWLEGSTSATAGYYFIDQSHGSATDSGNTYGHPDLPRLTPPEGELAPGSFVYFDGGTYDGTYSAGDRFNWRGAGTDTNPIWITGNQVTKPVFQDDIHIAEAGAASYLIIEYLENSGHTNAIIETRPLVGSADHILVRYNTLTGTSDNADPEGVISFGTTTGALTVEYVVAYSNTISNYGVYNSAGEDGNDESGISAGANSTHIWALNNTIFRMGGDSIFGCHTCTDAQRPQYYYIGGNTMYENDENALDLKGTEFVIISQNEMYGPWNDGGQYAIVLHGGQHSVRAKDTWVIFNDIHDSGNGVHSTLTEDLYIIGNQMYDIVDSGNGDPHDGSVIGIRDTSGEIYIVDNTFARYDKGTTTASSSTTHHHYGNIYFDGTDDAEYEVELRSGGEANFNTDYNIYYDSGDAAAFYWSSAARDFSYMQGTASEEANSAEDNPDFVNAASDDFNLTVDSPAVDASIELPSGATVYDKFFSDWGRSIEFDFDGESRPLGSSWDVGAFEFVAGGSAPDAPSGLGATAVSTSQINLSWTDNSSDESGFRIERSTTSGSGFSQIDTAAANATTYNDTGLSAETTYYYRIRAYNGSGNSSYTSEASDTTDAEASPASTSQKLNTGAINLLQ